MKKMIIFLSLIAFGFLRAMEGNDEQNQKNEMTSTGKASEVDERTATRIFKTLDHGDKLDREDLIWIDEDHIDSTIEAIKKAWPGYEEADIAIIIGNDAAMNWLNEKRKEDEDIQTDVDQYLNVMMKHQLNP